MKLLLGDPDYGGIKLRGICFFQLFLLRHGREHPTVINRDQLVAKRYMKLMTQGFLLWFSVHLRC